MQNAYRFEATSAARGGKYVTISVSSGTTYTLSFYAKSLSGTQKIRIGADNGCAIPQGAETFEITTEWQRISTTITSTQSGWNIFFDNVESGTACTGTYLDADLLVYGFQVEAGSYSTSLIPTYGASVTRSADSSYKTGISSLIGQTEGTIFYDGYFGNQGNEVYFFIQDSLGTSITSSIFAQKLSSSEIVFRGYNSSNVLQWEIIGNGYSIGQRIKIGGGYKSNDIVLYINGTQIGVDTSASIPTCTSLQLGTYPANPVANNNISKPINEVILFPTRLTNDELAELTTI